MASELEESESDQQGPQERKARKPRPYVDLKKLERLMWLQPSQMQTALFFDTTQDHIAEIIEHNYGFTFAEYREKNQINLRLTLVQKALQMALEDKNTAMMIFALKNINKWSDNNFGENNGGQIINLKYNLMEPPDHEVKDVTPNDPAN